MVDELDIVDLILRRYHSDGSNDPEGHKCLVHPYGYHNAEVFIGEVPIQLDEKGYMKYLHTDHADERWPKVCVCGYQFKEIDAWQTNQQRIFKNQETNELYRCPEWKLPPGALFYKKVTDWPWWFPNPQDGKILACITPDGEWVIDGTAGNGPKDAAGWTRTGIPPSLVVKPSIQCGNYHGFLGGADGSKPGFLVEC
jgi:hypothetical protein